MTCHKLWPVRGHILTFLDAFEKDAIACVEIIRQARPDLVAMFDQMQRPRPELTCFSYALAEVEDAVLASVEQQLKTMGYTVAAPCFDGLIISLPAEHVLESFDLAFLAELKTSVRDDLDFEVDFTVRRVQGDDTDAEIANAIEAEISHESSSFWYEVGLNSVGTGVPIVEVGGRLVCVPSAVAAYARWQGRAEIAQQLEDMCSQTSGPYTCQRVMAACSKVHISEAVVHVHVGAGKPSGNTASILTDQHGYIVYHEGHGAVIHRDGNSFFLLDASSDEVYRMPLVSLAEAISSCAGLIVLFPLEFADAPQPELARDSLLCILQAGARRKGIKFVEPVARGEYIETASTSCQNCGGKLWPRDQETPERAWIIFSCGAREVNHYKTRCSYNACHTIHCANYTMQDGNKINSLKNISELGEVLMVILLKRTHTHIHTHTHASVSLLELDVATQLTSAASITSISDVALELGCAHLNKHVALARSRRCCYYTFFFN
jgi:hypothetical protein